MRKVIAGLFLPPRPSDTEYYHAVDLLRGLAAMAVVLFHYLNFYIPAGQVDAVANFRDLEPLHQMLWPFYQYGLYAVQLFWLVSGFVFAAVYAGRAREPGKFFVNRFARLYPLHFVTLLVVAALQFGRLHALGDFQTYQFNDLYHFVLNLFFASSWGLERGMSFNGPIWSVSVEVAIYAAFLVTLPFLYRRGILGPLALAVIFTSGSVFKLPGTVFWQCGFYFFLGSAIYIAFGALRDRPLLFALAGIGALCAAAAACLKPNGIGIAHLMPIVLPGIFLLACAIEATGRMRKSRWTAWIGDNTYGVYLWHIPIQLALMLMLDIWVGSRAIANSPAFLLAFVAIVMCVARLSFLVIERPARDAIKSWYRQRSARSEPQAEAQAIF